jgi:DNA polymerase-1
MTTIHLIDASPYLFRAYFSVPKTVPNNAVYGFRGFLNKYVKEEQPTHLAVCFDRHFNQSFRNEWYAPYKAQRDASPPELDAQVDPSLELVVSLGMAAFIDERFEADDLIATILAQTRGSGASYVIVTSDKDMTQLVCDRVTWYDPARNIRLDTAGVEAKFGVRPEQIVDFLALAGDAVDNIPGVRGIGPKTAAQLLRRYGTLEEIYANVPAMRASHAKSDRTVAEKLAEHVELAGLSKRLATVSTEAPLEVSVDALRLRSRV